MRVSERCWPIRKLLSVRIGVINFRFLSLISHKEALKMAKETTYREVAFALSKRFPESIDLHTAIYYNKLTLPPAAAGRQPEPDYDLLALVERFLPEKVSKLPPVAERISEANVTAVAHDLSRLVKHPLLLVRLATCNNPLLPHLRETSNFPDVREQIDRNKIDKADPKNVKLVSLSTGRQSGEIKRPSGEAPRQPAETGRQRPPSRPT